MHKIRFVGLDVHAKTIAVAVAEPNGEVRSLGLIPNRPESIRQLVRKLEPVEQLRFCYEGHRLGIFARAAPIAFQPPTNSAAHLPTAHSAFRDSGNLWPSAAHRTGRCDC